ncbi:MAG: hypothetical protein V3W18_00375 [candidate division Zixibacteria bacterium]
MLDITGIMIGVSMVLLTWAVARLNDKVDRHIKKFRRFEDALKKSASGRIRQNSTDYKETPQDVYQQ